MKEIDLRGLVQDKFVVPASLKYLAIDPIGAIWGYEKEPRFVNHVWNPTSGRYQLVAHADPISEEQAAKELYRI